MDRVASITYLISIVLFIIVGVAAMFGLPELAFSKVRGVFKHNAVQAAAVRKDLDAGLEELIAAIDETRDGQA